MNVKFPKNCENTGKILRKLHVKVKFCEIWHPFSRAPIKKFSLVLLQMTNYIFSPGKM